MSASGDSQQGLPLGLEHLYLDFDGFFASAEQTFNPGLRGKPVGVVPLDVPGTGCIALSREAKALGVPSGASIADARAARPDIVLVVARPDAYVRLHHRILAVIDDVLPIGKVRSIDEMMCPVPPERQDDPARLAHAIKRALAREFGPALTCSIGVAQTELLAKIAAERDKPDGFTVLPPGRALATIADIELTKVPGISKGISARLEKAGIADFSALYAMDRKHMRALWGSIEGERFWNALHGYPYERPATTKRMFGHSRMLPPDWRTPEMIAQCARQLLMSAARRLRRSDLAATRITMSARGGGYRNGVQYRTDNRRWSRELAIAPARDDLTLQRELRRLLAIFGEEVRFKPRSISVTLHGLVDADAPQGDLFAGLEETGTGGGTPGRRRGEKLSAVLDSLRERHGAAAASLGPVVSVPGGYLGGKIAFGRIPELSDFTECATEDGDTHFATV
ncbi:Y-family DNA polymerase [Erythrobacter sp.]|jgi:DNA polymerase-4|uniref:Y-family DNA polymerase n=1 Tax=Erythrobacter sp. TaxID=1042 RepID=UPI002EBB3049|nr:type VI secretion protein ImpB [Erythrobacter sp.]